MINKIIKHKKDILKDGILKRKANGYLFVKAGINWLPEHVLCVENKIGRTLNKGEVIHHIDGNRENNDIKNLMLFKSQKEHKSFENKIRQHKITNPIKLQIENRWKEFE